MTKLTPVIADHHKTQARDMLERDQGGSMTDRELMQQALEALNRSDYLGWQLNIPIIKALRERLAQPEMQPCAGRNCGSTNPNLHSAECFEDYEKATGMNQWVDLTHEEMKSIQMQSWNKYPGQNMEKFDAWKCQELTQSKLREKNT